MNEHLMWGGTKVTWMLEPYPAAAYWLHGLEWKDAVRAPMAGQSPE